MILFAALCLLALAIAGLTAMAIFWPLTIIHMRDRHADALSALGGVPFFHPKAFVWLLQRKYRSLNDGSLSGLATPAYLSLMCIILGVLGAGVLWLVSALV